MIQGHEQGRARSMGCGPDAPPPCTLAPTPPAGKGSRLPRLSGSLLLWLLLVLQPRLSPPPHPQCTLHSRLNPQPPGTPHPHPGPALPWVPMAAGTHFCNGPGIINDFSVCPRRDRAWSDFSCGSSIQHQMGNNRKCQKLLNEWKTRQGLKPTAARINLPKL